MRGDRSLPVTEPAFTDIDALLERLEDLWSWIEVTKSKGAFFRNNDPRGSRTKVRVPKKLLKALIEDNRVEHAPSERYHAPVRQIYQIEGAGDRARERWVILRALRASGART